MRYVIVRNEDGKYVTEPGSKNSYTATLKRARVFKTRDEANRDKCGNESVVPVSKLIT